MRCVSLSNPARLALLVVCAGTPRGLIAQDCNADGVPDAAQTLLWVSPNPGAAFANALSWQNLGLGGPQAPQQGSVLLFDEAQSGVPVAVGSLGGTVQVAGLEVASGEAVVDVLGGSVLSVTGTTPGCREVAIGTVAGQPADLAAIGNGSLSLARLVVGVTPGSFATATLDGMGPAALTLSTGELIVGAGGDGVFSVFAGGANLLGPVTIGDAGFGTLDLFGGSSALTFASSLVAPVIVGRQGDGIVRLAGGASATTDAAPIALVLGEQPGSMGTIRLGGLGTDAALSLTTMEVGRFGSGTVTIDGGAVLQTAAADSVVLGVEAGSSGTATIADGLWEETGAPVVVGGRGSGRLTLGDGGVLAGDVVAFRRGTVRGGGAIDGTLRVSGGRLVPGAVIGSSRELVVNGPLELLGTVFGMPFLQNGRLSVRIDGLAAGEFDSVRTTAGAFVSGTLTIDADASVALPLGGAATLVRSSSGRFGVFGGVTVPSFDNGTTLAIEYGATDVVARVVNGGETAPAYEPPIGFATSGALPQSAAVVGDVTGDGFADLLVVATSVDEGQLVVLKNLGVDANGGWLGFGQPASFGTIEGEPVGLGLGDIDGDDRLDAVFVSRDPAGPGGVVRVRRNSPNAPGDFPQFLGGPIVVENDPVDLAVADVNDDGVPDPVVAGTVLDNGPNPGPGGRGARTATTGRVTVVDLPTGSAEDIDLGVQPGSIDTYSSASGPGSADVAVTCTGEGMVFVLQNDGAGQFPTQQGVTVGINPTGLDTGDIDGDGLADLLTTDTDSGTVSIVRSVPGSSPIFFQTSVLFETDDQPGSEPVSGVFSDLDGDGDLDVAVIARDDGGVPRVRRLLFQGLGAAGELVFETVEDADPPALGEPTPIELLTTDVDGDGVEDLVVIYAEPGGALRAERMVPLPAADVSVRLGVGPACPADLAAPFGVLDLADVDAFIAAFAAADPLADLAAPFGLIDLADIDAFIASYLAGCP
jgi:hypothetical protein